MAKAKRNDRRRCEYVGELSQLQIPYSSQGELCDVPGRISLQFCPGGAAGGVKIQADKASQFEYPHKQTPHNEVERLVEDANMEVLDVWRQVQRGNHC